MEKKLLLALSAIFLISCSKDDDVNMGHLTGRKWYRSYHIFNGTNFPYDHSCPASKDYLEFLADADTFKDVVYTSLSGCIPREEVGTYSVNGKIITRSGQIIRSEVNELTSTKLTLTDYIDTDGNGTVERTSKNVYTSD